MTPKDKAQELVDKFGFSFSGIVFNDENFETLGKQCALIAVDEILAIVYLEHQEEYWEQVKQEIEKL